MTTMRALRPPHSAAKRRRIAASLILSSPPPMGTISPRLPPVGICAGHTMVKPRLYLLDANIRVWHQSVKHRGRPAPPADARRRELMTNPRSFRLLAGVALILLLAG